MTKKKILFFHFDLKGGGAEKVLVNLVNNLDKNKYDITVKTIFGVGTHISNLASHIRYQYVFKKQFPGFTFLQRFFSPRFLHQLFIKEKYDLEIAYIETSPTRIISGCPNKDTKKMTWLHITLNHFPWFRSGKEMAKVYKSFDKIVSVSKDVQDAFIHSTGLEGLPYVVQRNVVDSDYIREKSKEEIDNDINILDYKKKLCYIGRLIPTKDPMRLLKALTKIKARGICNWHLYILGTGELEIEIRNYISANELTSDVTLLGYQTNPYKYIAKMDLYVCCSHAEGYSTAATEALILNIPVLTTACGGMKEILEDGKYGMIVPDNNNAFEKMLEQFITDDELYLRYKTLAEQRSLFFDMHSIIKENENLIDLVLNS